jgi:DNA-binding LacI/PurR family transcriptional regulator
LKKRVSIKQVAEHAGVSVATVSLVLNDKGSISPRTRKQVRKSAQALGFILNKSASRLRSGKSLLIGLIVNDIANPFFAELSADVESVAAEAGYLSVLANTGDDGERQKSVIETMIGQGVAGFIISAASDSDASSFKVIQDHGIPYVLCVRDVQDYSADFIGFDNFRAGLIAAEHLLERGHERLAFIGGVETNANRQRRLDGVRDVLQRRGLSLDKNLDIAGPATRQFGSDAASRVLENAPDISAIVCFNDFVAIGAYSALNNADKGIGRDVALIGFDNVPESAAWTPPLTTVELFPRAIGARAAKALIEKIYHPEQSAERIYLTPQLIVRQST